MLVEGFRPGVMDRLGRRLRALSKALNPRLIYCAITGYGQDGPYRLRAGHDVELPRASRDCSALNGAERRALRRCPGVQLADLAGGSLHGGRSAFCSRSRRARGPGEGQFVDVSMTDGSLALMYVPFASFLANGVAATNAGNEGLSGRYACYQHLRDERRPVSQPGRAGA